MLEGRDIKGATWLAHIRNTFAVFYSHDIACLGASLGAFVESPMVCDASGDALPLSLLQNQKSESEQAMVYFHLHREVVGKNSHTINLSPWPPRKHRPNHLHQRSSCHRPASKSCSTSPASLCEKRT